MVPHFNFQTKQGPTVSVSNRDISFYECLEIIPTRNMTIFTLSVTIFGQFTGAFHFSNYIGEIDHFSLDFWKGPIFNARLSEVSICVPSERKPQWTRV